MKGDHYGERPRIVRRPSKGAQHSGPNNRHEGTRGKRALPGPVEQTYFLGATSVSVIIGGYLKVLEKTGGAGADEWLHEQIRGLRLILNDVSPRRIRITFGIDPEDGAPKDAPKA